MFEKGFVLAGALSACFLGEGPGEWSESDAMQLEAHLPGIQQVQEAPEGADLEIPDLPRADLPHLIYHLARKKWIDQGLFPVHAACVGDSRRGYVLLVGNAGCGKTSTALHCAQSKGLRVYSGDKTLVRVEQDGSLSAVAGTQVMTSRSDDRFRWGELADHAVETGGRRCFRLKQEHQAEDEKVKIVAIALLQLNDGVASEKRLPGLSAAHRLTPYFMDMERADLLLDGGETVLDGTVSPETKQREIPKLVRSINEIPTVKLTGSIDFVSDGIERLL